VEHYADLLIGGEIQHQKKIYSTPSAWSTFVKNRSDNGWTSITYQGVKLSQWRNISHTKTDLVEVSKSKEKCS